MTMYTTIEFEKQTDIGIIWLNRPDIHNAFNEVMIQEVIDCVEEVNLMDDIRVLIIRGRGKSFCAGARSAALPWRPPAPSPWTKAERKWDRRVFAAPAA